MSILDSNITEEERISSYSANEPGDESFIIETMDGYPGVFPDFVEDEAPIIPAESAFEDNFDGDSGLDDFDDSQFDEFEDVDENYTEDLDDDGLNSNLFEDSELDLENFEDNSNVETRSSIFGDDEIETLSDEELSELSGSSQVSKEGIELDDDLKALIQSDLKKSQENTIRPEDEIEIVNNEEFPIDEDLSAEVVDFNTIEADKPSNYGIGELPPEEQTKPKEEEPQPKKKKEKEGSNKKLFIIFGSVAAILLVSLVSIYFVFQDSFLEKNKDNKDSLATKSKNEKQAIVEKKHSDNKHIEKEAVKNVSTNSHSEVEENVNETREIKNNEKIENINIKTEVNNSNKLNESIPKKIVVENPKVIAKTEITKNEIVKPNLKSKVHKTKVIDDETFIPKTNDESKRNKVKNNNDLAVIHYDDNSSKNQIEKKSEVPYSRKEMSDEGVFTIQVYASQSKEDALQWVSKLKSQNIKDAFISEQQVRDVIWYRVRFGSFTQKSKAIEVAAKLGYAQTWIDRVK